MAVTRRTQSPQVLLCGYYGEHNLGDDALLAVLLDQIPSPWMSRVTAHDSEAVQGLHHCNGVRAVQRRSLKATAQALIHSDALVLGGGSLLQDSTSFKSLIYYICLLALARLRSIPVILWGQGLGPLNRWTSRLLVRLILPGVRAIGWRDPASKRLADQWHVSVPTLVAADPVWSFPGVVWDGQHCADAERSGIVLCWRPTHQLNLHEWARLIEVVNQLAEDQSLPVTWLAFHKHQDHPLPGWLETQGLMPETLARRSRFQLAESLDQVLTLFSRSQLVLPMRLHALILSQLAGAPCAALSYDPKVAEAAAMAKLDCVDLDHLPSFDDLMRRWTDQLMHPVDAHTIDCIKEDAGRHGAMLHRELSRIMSSH